MNRLPGTVLAIQSAGEISLVDVDVMGDVYTSVVVETPRTAPWLAPGGAVHLLFKETEVSLGKGLGGLLSLRNRIPARLVSLRRGELLSELTLDYRGIAVVSIVTTRSVERMALVPGDEVEALVKANEMMLVEREA